jgi:hypothetical protein
MVKRARPTSEWPWRSRVFAVALISQSLLAEATRPQSEHYGYGFDSEGEWMLRSYGHSGGAPGINGDLRVFPQLGYMIVAVSNLDPPAASRLADYFVLRMPASP